MSLPLVTITLLNYNDRRTIFHSIESVVTTKYPNLELIIIDNNSTDGTSDEIEAKIPEWTEQRKEGLRPTAYSLQPSWLRFIRNQENVGFARGHNQAIRQARGEFILCLNSDAILTPMFVEEALKPFADPKVGVVQGKLIRYDFGKNTPKTITIDTTSHSDPAKAGEESLDPSATPQDDTDREVLNVIDTTGLLVFKNRRIVNRGQGEPDRGQYNRAEEVFGADGAVPVYRKAVLDDVALPIFGHMPYAVSRMQNKNGLRPTAYGLEQEKEFFDEDFFLYKEDVDLAWRLRLAGWKTMYTPRAVAYHGRGSGDSMATNPFDIIRERRKINPLAKFYSFRNQRLMQIKNEFPSLLFRDVFHWLPKEIAAWGYSLLFEGLIVPKAIWQWMSLVPRALTKRRLVMAKRRVDAKDFTHWFV